MDLIDDQHIREMSGSYEFYRDFHTMEHAKIFAQMLEVHRIPYKLENSQTLLDAAIVGHGLVPTALIKVRSSDFKRVNNLLREKVLNDPSYIEDHYLHDLDDKELIAIVRKPTDWNVEDVTVARTILNQRGIPIPIEHIEDFTKKINAELHKGKKARLGWLCFYLVLVIVGGWFINPLFLLGGIGMGWYYWQDKTIDNQGVKYFTFEKQSRFYGKMIFYIGWISVLLGAFLIYRNSISDSLSIYQPTQHFQVESVL